MWKALRGVEKRVPAARREEKQSKAPGVVLLELLVLFWLHVHKCAALVGSCYRWIPGPGLHRMSSRVEFSGATPA